MFRKIHSNRRPAETIYRALQTEFGSYFEKTGDAVVRLLKSHPQKTFVAMCLLILFSGVLSFTLLRQHDQAGPAVADRRLPAQQQTVSSRAGDGLNQLVQTTSALQQTLRLKRQVESLLAKRQMTATDSTQLETALDQLGQLQQHLNSKP